jgi:predicted small lipoprotein YifL
MHIFLVALLCFILCGCNGFFYLPSSKIIATPKDAQLEYEEIKIVTEGQPTLLA